MKIAEKAFAKVNLHLDVLKKRKDGYHDIGTIFQTIGIHDELEFESRDDSEIVLAGAEGLTDSLQDNLIYQAAVSLRSFALENSRFLSHSKGSKPQQVGATITLKKSLPAGAGLGGGSADAAATLRGLRKLWELDVSNKELEVIGVPLGADVPFMVLGGSQVARGIGEILEEIPLDSFVEEGESRNWLEESRLLIVTPSDFVSTATAYAELKPRGEELFESYMSNVNQTQKVQASQQLFFNHFEETVFPNHPQIKELKEWMIDSGAQFAIMSGSGASVFGVFKEKEAAEKALGLVDEHFSGLRFKKVTFFKKKLLNP